MDDLNALAEALVSAINESDEPKSAELCASLNRFTLALGWNVDGVLPAILTYASRHSGDELFAPAFVLRSIAPERPETIDLWGRLSADVQTLLEHLHEPRL
jgi:hypothetical protein